MISLCYLRSSEYCMIYVEGMWVEHFKQFLNSKLYIVFTNKCLIYYIFHGDSLSRVMITAILTIRGYMPILFLIDVCVHNIKYVWIILFIIFK